MGNNASYRVADFGTVEIKIFDGVIRMLGDMRHIPNLTTNLISMSDSKGYIHW